jgi:hypothetical protein
MKNSISVNSSRLLFGTQGPKTSQIHTTDPERDNAPNRALRSTISLTPRIVPHARSSPVKRCRFNRSMQGGVYGAEETVEAFCGAEGPAVEPLEIGAVVERDWAGPRQRSCGRSIFGSALWWDCSACPPALAITITLAEREDISRGIATGSSIRGIAKGLKRAVSTVGREVARHGGRPLDRASEADHQAWESALRP